MTHSMTETIEIPKPTFLTAAEAGDRIGMTADGVRKLIRAGKLKAIRLSERKIRIPLPALEAYQRRVNGEPRVSLALPEVGELPELREEFEGVTGYTPEVWLQMWKRDELDDSAENMTLVVRAGAIQASTMAAETRRDLARTR